MRRGGHKFEKARELITSDKRHLRSQSVYTPSLSTSKRAARAGEPSDLRVLHWNEHKTKKKNTLPSKNVFGGVVFVLENECSRKV